jgi:hypothetical protein
LDQPQSSYDLGDFNEFNNFFFVNYFYLIL